MFSEDWSTHIKIDRQLIKDQLEEQFIEIDHKIILRFYTIKPSGTQLLVNGICEVLHRSLAYFVYGSDEIEKDPVWAGANAGQRFGFKDPQTDGKYGELLLFVLVESVLGCKMVAHKLASLSNFNDQVKGGDGVFVGNYEIEGKSYPAFLIGESKVIGGLAAGLTDAFKSLARFYNEDGGPKFLDQELIVAQQFISTTHHSIDELYNRLTPTKPEFHEQVLIHPVMIMYSSAYDKLELAAASPADLSAAIRKRLQGNEKKYLEKVQAQYAKHPNVGKVYLDFFIIPCRSVDEFRDAMYQRIHHAPFQRS